MRPAAVAAADAASLVALGGSMDALFDTSTSNAWRSAQHAGGGPQEEPSTAKARRLTERISNENTLALKHRAGRRAVNDLDFKLEHPPTAAVQVVAPPPAANVVELVPP